MVDVLSTFSDALAATVESASPGVVRVEGRRRLPASGFVWSGDGVVVTAHHAVEADQGITLGLADGQTVSASLVGRDPTTDLAVLRAQSKDLAPPALADGDGLQVGHLVLALGRPGEAVRATLGIVSALGNIWHTPAGGSLDRYLQTDVVMYPGFSGGPLVDVNGHVLGLNTSALLRGVSMAIPSQTISRVVNEIIAHGRIRRGYLGVGSQPVRLPPTVADKIGQETGILLVSIAENGPAQEHGLHLGDTIVSLAGGPVHSMDDLMALLSGDRIGTTVPVQIVRGGQLLEISLKIGERP